MVAKVVIGAEDRASAVIGHVQGRMGLLNKQGLAMGVAFAGITMAIQAVSKAFQALNQWISESIQKHREFEKSMAEVNTMLDGLTTNIDEMTRGVEYLSTSFGKSAVDLSRGLYQVLSASVDAADAMNFLNIATKASIAGLTSVETAVDTLTTVMNAYGYTTEQMVYTSDILFATIKKGKLRFDDLSSSLGYVVSTAATSGVEFKELMSALATTTRFGLRMDMTARGMTQAILSVVNPTEEARNLAAQYGVDLSALSLKTKGLAGFFKDLGERIGHNNALLTQIIPNTRAYRVAVILAGKGVEGLAEDIEYMSRAMGKTDEAFMKMASTSQFQADIVAQQLEKVDRELGEVMTGFDIGVKKAEVFFKSLLTGQDILKNLGKIDEIINSINNRFVEMQMEGLQNLVEPPKQLYEILTDTTTETDRLGEISKKAGKAMPFIKNAMEAKQLLEDMKPINDELNRMQAEREIISPYSAISHDIKESGLRDELARLEDRYDTVTGSMQEHYDDYAYFKSAIDEASQAITSHEQTISDLKTELTTLNVELRESYKGYEGRLYYQKAVMIAEKDVQDMVYGVNHALKDQKYQHLITNKTLADAVRKVREYEQSQEDARRETEANTLAQNKNSLAIMKIQYGAMGRRGKLRRHERRAIERYERENMGIRIQAMEADIQKKESGEHEKYLAAKELIDQIMRDEQHALYVLKDTRQEDINDFDALIKGKEDIFATHKDNLIIAYEDLRTASGLHHELLMGMQDVFGADMLKQFEDLYGVNIPAEIDKTIKKLKEVHALAPGIEAITGKKIAAVTSVIPALLPEPLKQILGINTKPPWMQRGGRIAQTGLIWAHKDETISPSGAGDRNVVVNYGTGSIQVNVKTDASGRLDPVQVAHAIRRAMGMNLIGSDGITKSHYR